MKRFFRLAAIMAILGLALSVFSPVKADEPTPVQQQLPYVTSQYRILRVLPPHDGNISAITWKIPQPLNNQGVVRMGGDHTLDSGNPLGVLLLGNKAPTEVNLVLGLVSGEGSMTLQYPTCPNGDDPNPEPLNDLFKEIWVAEWVYQTPGFELGIWTDDENGVPTGDATIYRNESLAGSPWNTMEAVAILLPENMNNKVSLAESMLTDSWHEIMQNRGAHVVGWKDSGPARGVSLTNGGSFSQSLQVPPCPNPGGEYTNDMAKPWLFVPRHQLEATGDQFVTVSENDLDPSDPGQQYSITFATYRTAFWPKLYLPIALR